MKSGNRPYVPELDQLRGLAAILVIYYHSLQRGYYTLGGEGWIIGGSPLQALVYEGHTAVSLFIVVSGFVLARGLFGKTISYGRFLKNRALRILPLMTFLIVFAIYGSKEYSLSELLAPFLLLTNTPIAFKDETHLTGTLWTITVLFQLYLIAPLLFTFVSRGGLLRFLLPAMAFIFTIKLLVLFANRQDPDDLFAISYYSIVGRFNQFLVGIGLAFLWPAITRRVIRRGQGLAVAAAAFTAILGYCYVLNRSGGIMAWHTWHVIVPELEAAMWAVFVAGFMISRPIGMALGGRALASVGIMSYSLYILHWPTNIVAWDLYEETKWLLFESLAGAAWFTTLVIVPASLAIAALSYWCVERPFLTLRGNYIEPSRTAPHHAAA